MSRRIPTNKALDDFDKTGRMSAEDQEMAGRLQLTNFEKLQNLESTATPHEHHIPNESPSTTAPTSLASTPQDTSFMTEEKMKSIYLPKKIDF
jgi:hypothetical protein